MRLSVGSCSFTAGVQTVCRQLWERVAILEEELYDTERLYIVREAEVPLCHEPTCIHINNMSYHSLKKPAMLPPLME